MTAESKTELVQELEQRIAQMGTITFAEFMQEALYHPTHGYYMDVHQRIGKQGDFFTSSSVHACFGQLIARQLEQMWQLLGKGPFVIAEQGGGDGHLCLDILDAIAREAPDFYQQISYRLVEISAASRNRQAELLEQHVAVGRVDWCEFAQLKGMQGCFLSNELVDSFPVHLLEKHAGRLQEVYVVQGADGFAEETGPLSSPALEDYLQRLGIDLLEGNRCEVNLAAVDWIKQVAEVLKRGFVLTIDYGYPAEELYAPGRHAGTLLCYHRHQSNEDPYRRVGCQDITAHVDFTSLQQAGTRRGLKTLYFGHQYQFLMALGFVDLLTELQQRADDPNKAQAIRMTLKNLILPEGGMGELFRVLIQGKHVGSPELLCSRRIGDLAPPAG